MEDKKKLSEAQAELVTGGVEILSEGEANTETNAIYGSETPEENPEMVGFYKVPI